MSYDSHLDLPHSALPAPCGWPVRYLVLLHVAATVICGVLDANINEINLLGNSALVLVVSQSSLLGIWLTLGKGPWLLRSISTLAGLCILWSVVLHRTSNFVPLVAT